MSKTESVEREYQVYWLKEGKWVPEDGTRKSFGRKRLAKTLKGQFKLRAA